jgi:Flp pilus assembly protein TadG
MTARSKRSKNERGVVLVMAAVMTVVLFALLGLAVDMGRMFIIKHEAQVFADSAALAAALKLDGTQDGATNAASAVAASTNTWNMGTQTFASGSYTTTFANDVSGPWVTAASLPTNATGYTYVRVTVGLTVPVYFIGVVVPISSTPVNAISVAGQMEDTTLYAGGFPFTPMAFPGASTTDPTHGMSIGQQYTIRYPASAGKPVCPGDTGVHNADGSERGYWGDTSASTIAKRIVDDYQSGATVTIGEPIGLSGGAKTSEASSVNERAGQDGDQTSLTLADYEANPAHNGRRLVNMPITDYSTGIALGFGMFLLLPDGSYGHTGNSMWCAIYVGPGVEGASNPGAAGSPGKGLSHVRLVK